MSLLRVQAVSKSFGGVQAVSGVDFEVSEGELACIIGPNGAGKTTLFNLITGYYRPDRGRVTFDGRDITGVPPHRTARLGLVRSFQKTHVFSEMTVRENVQTMVQFRKHRSLNFLANATGLERPETASGSSWASRWPRGPSSCSSTSRPAECRRPRRLRRSS